MPTVIPTVPRNADTGRADRARAVTRAASIFNAERAAAVPIFFSHATGPLSSAVGDLWDALLDPVNGVHLR